MKGPFIAVVAQAIMVPVSTGVTGEHARTST